jgi:carbonic anhydrase
MRAVRPNEELDVPDRQPVSADEARDAAAAALRAVIEGNARFADGNVADHTLTPERRADLVEGQEPIAVVLGCVDSRVPTEIVLDQGVGEVLTVRTAGQALTGVALGSIEFGVRVLGIPLVVVLGHTGCGAVLAALKDDHPDGHLGELTGEVADRITGIVGKDPVRATGANVAATVDALRALGSLVTPDGNDAYVVGAVYDLATSKLEITDDANLPA